MISAYLEVMRCYSLEDRDDMNGFQDNTEVKIEYELSKFAHPQG